MADSVLLNPAEASRNTTASSSSILGPLTTEETQTPIDRLESDVGSLGKEEHVPLGRLDRLTGLIRDLEIAVDDDFHLIVRVLVNQRLARIETVEAGADGRLWREFLPSERASCQYDTDLQLTVELMRDGTSTHEENTSAKKALSFAIKGKVLTNLVCASP